MAVATTEAPALVRRRGSGVLGVLREVARRPKGVVGLVIVGGLILLAFFPGVFAPASPYAQNIVDRLQGPSREHLLGTDELGRDLLSRVIFGARIALGVSIPAVTAALLAGLVLGVIAGYAGGIVDSVMLVILMAMDIPSAIATEAGLSFLGLGVQPPTPSWGVILSDGFTNVVLSPWGIISASAALMIATLGFTMLGESLRDVADPQLARTRRWQRL